MAERDAYLIPVGNTLVEVSKEVYGAYYRVERHTRMLDEKDVRNGTVQYSNLDTRERLGVDLMTDRLAEPVEEVASPTAPYLSPKSRWKSTALW